MSNGMFHSIDWKVANDEELREAFADETLVLTTDIGKEEMYTGLSHPDGEVEKIVSWQHPEDLEGFGAFVDRLQAREVTLVIEPTGTYQEPLRHYANDHDWEVRLVPTNRIKQARELYDGVPSIHDPKSTWVMAKLHADEMSRPWGVTSPAKRELKAAVRMMSWFEEDRRRYMNRLESCLARHWPKSTTLLSLDSATLLELLETFGSPDAIAEEPDRARRLMQEVSQGLLRPRKIEAIVEAARQTVGQPMVELECSRLQELAAHLSDIRDKKRRWKRRVEARVSGYQGAEQVGEVVGKTTAAVFETAVGDFREFDSPAALLKKFGLNLREKSSGNHQGQLRITKRGPAEARSYLYWATLRMIRENEVFRAWHHKKIERDGGEKLKSVVALMRKLVKGLWHVARGKPFDATKLFDVSRLAIGGTERA